MSDDDFKKFLQKDESDQSNTQLPILMFLRNKSEYILKSCDFLIGAINTVSDDPQIKDKLKATLMKMLDQIHHTSVQYDYSVMDMENENDEEDIEEDL